MARPIGSIVPRLIANALELARIQHFLNSFDHCDRKFWIIAFYEDRTISADETHLLIQHNELEAA